MMTRMIHYIAQNSDKFVNAVFEHIVFLVIIPVSIATLISLPLGIICSRHRKIGRIIMNIVSILQTIPSLALLAFMITIGSDATFHLIRYFVNQIFFLCCHSFLLYG